ncbi:hypothetical protein EYF80_066973 [Liparis tanakae]|uniref:Uncharacterized protein n=1 Tax=Liparis tanakae TaxID=230148 RepID=A0A4Z2E2E5_9TELE|nr:hypothetical protein EYF80_066973 [Liparis tanakae]
MGSLCNLKSPLYERRERRRPEPGRGEMFHFSAPLTTRYFRVVIAGAPNGFGSGYLRSHGVYPRSFSRGATRTPPAAL